MERHLQPHAIVLRSLVIASLSLAACGDDGDVTSREAADSSALALSTGFDMASMSQRFEAATVLASTPIAGAPRLAIEGIEARIRAAVTANACLTVDTDNATYIELTFDDCALGLLGLARADGSLRGELWFETAPCGPAECPTAMLVTLSTDRLRLSGPMGNRWIEIVGSWSLRDPIGGTQPTATTTDVTLAGELGSLTLVGGSSFSFDAAGCVDLDAEVRVEVMGRPSLGEVAIDVDGVYSCPAQCPSQGSVSIAFGLGEILAWNYDGAGAVSVTGPRGKEVDLALPCSFQ